MSLQQALPALYATGVHGFNLRILNGHTASKNYMRQSGVRKQARLAQPGAGRGFVLFLFLLLLPVPGRGQPAKPLPAPLAPAQAQALVDRALANEIRALKNPRPMSFWLRRSSPRLTTTKKIVETRDGDVARLISINGKPLSAAAEQRELARLNGLLSDPSRQMTRKQSEDADTARALKVLRALPTAFLYQYAGPGEGPAGEVEKFTFKPNPAFDPSDLELHVLTAMAGQVWIDPAAQRVVRLQGRLQHGVNFAWGILGHLNKGGSIRIEQADVGHHQWRIVRMRLAMTGRVLFFTKTYDTEEEESRFEPLPADLDYRQAVQMLRKDP